ncbi:MAG: hypothetical protein M0036_22425 [Desulfobacteraceae bacterium]|nr:hypothetical protein [Desulfobacteraceae bacterium]
MIPRGLATQEIPPNTADHLFYERLKLLIIMTKAYVKGYPLGESRAVAIRQNADFIFHQSLLRARQTSEPDVGEEKNGGSHLLFQRAQLLAVMAHSAAQGNFAGRFRLQAMADNVAWLCDHLCDQLGLSDALFLKVA